MTQSLWDSRTTTGVRTVIFISRRGGKVLRFQRKRIQRAHGGKDKEERRDMQRSRDDQYGRVAEAVIEQLPGELPKHHTAERAAQAHKAGDGSDGSSRKKVRGQS